MEHKHANPALRKGRFLWMEPAARNAYLSKLKERISEGYFYSDRIFSKIADDLAPVLEEVVASD